MISNNSIVLLTSPHLLTARAHAYALAGVLLLVTIIIRILMNTIVMVVSQELLASLYRKISLSGKYRT